MNSSIDITPNILVKNCVHTTHNLNCLLVWEAMYFFHTIPSKKIIDENDTAYRDGIYLSTVRSWRNANRVGSKLSTLLANADMSSILHSASTC